MDHTQIHAAVEIADDAGKTFETADNARKVAKVISASHAFRKYDWLHGIPVMNTSGNLRGMVLSAKWRGAFELTVKYGKELEHYHVGTLITVAVALADSFEQIDRIWRSPESGDIKAAKLASQATAIATNCLTGVVTPPVHAVLQSLQGYCYMTDVAKGNLLGTCGESLKKLDLAIESFGKQVSNGDEIYVYVNTTINPKISRMLGL
jgi:hypothetical protein